MASAVARVVSAPQYYEITFSEAVNISADINTTVVASWPSAINPNNWSANGAAFVAYGTASPNIITSVSTKVVRFTPLAASPSDYGILGDSYYITCRSVEDVAGNQIAGATTTAVTAARIYGVVLP